MLKKIIYCALLNLVFSNSNSGWFICHKYKGLIGNDSVIFEIQMERRYSTTEKNILLANGVYLFTKQNSPIRLSGSFDQKSKELILHESNKPQSGVVFKLLFSEELLVGKMVGARFKNSETVRLKKVNSLIDTLYDSDKFMKNIEIIQDTSLKNYILIGVYSIKPLRDASMDSLRILNKFTGTVFQTIDLSTLDFPAGNLVTNIFRNVEIRKNGDYNDILIWCWAGKRGGFYRVVYDFNSKRYILNREAKLYIPAVNDDKLPAKS